MQGGRESNVKLDQPRQRVDTSDDGDQRRERRYEVAERELLPERPGKSVGTVVTLTHAKVLLAALLSYTHSVETSG